MRNGIVLALALWSVGLAGCAHDEESALVIKSFHLLKVEEEGCTYTDNAYTSNVYDAWVGMRDAMPFVVFLEVENHLAPNADQHAGRPESRGIVIEELEVRFEGGLWDSLPGSARIPVSGTLVPPAGGAHFSSELVPVSVASLLVTQSPLNQEGVIIPLHLHVQAHGRTLDGAEVSSSELSFRLDVCKRCLLDPCTDEGGVLVPACRKAGAQLDGAVCIFGGFEDED